MDRIPRSLLRGGGHFGNPRFKLGSFEPYSHSGVNDAQAPGDGTYRGRTCRHQSRGSVSFSRPNERFAAPFTRAPARWVSGAYWKDIASFYLSSRYPKVDSYRNSTFR
jgi:hypothetical protein